MSKSILITGASGRTGRSIVKSLSRFGADVTSFIRDSDKKNEMLSIGSSNVALGDMLDKDSIRESLVNIDTVFHIGPPMCPDEVEITNNFINISKSQGVKKFIYYSVMHPLRRNVRHHKLKLDCEEMLIESGLPYSIIQPIRYMQHVNINFLNQSNNPSVLSMPFDINKKFNVVDLEDLAVASAKIALDDKWLYGTYELAGPDSLSQNDMVNIILDIIREKKISFPNGVIARRMEIDQLRAKANETGISEDKLNQMIIMNNHYNKYGFLGNSKVLEMIIERPPNTFKNYFSSLLEDL